MEAKYEDWLELLPKTYPCSVKVKYKPDYYLGMEETLRWLPQCNALLFWRQSADLLESTGIWWRWIESIQILTR